MDRPGYARIKPPKAPPGPNGRGAPSRGGLYSAPLQPSVGADSISARPAATQTSRADMESAPTANGKCPDPMDGRAAARLQFWNYPCFENAAKRPPALPKAEGRPLHFSCGYPARRCCGPKFRRGRRPFSGAGTIKKWPLSKRPLFLEVTTRFELVNEGFADPCLTTWPRHHINQIPAVGPVSVICGAADEARTRYLHLGKVALYQMSYGRKICSLYEENIRETWCLRSESNQ